MDPIELRTALMNFAAVSEEEPFRPGIVVYKVLGKMYALCTYESPLTVNLKCEPGRALELRNRFEAINPGYHMNKKHWNTVTVDGSIPKDLLLNMIHCSYELVVKGMTKKDQAKVKAGRVQSSDPHKDWHSEFLHDISND